MLMMMSYVPETRTAENTSIKLPCCIKLAFTLFHLLLFYGYQQILFYDAQYHITVLLYTLNINVTGILS